MGGYGSGREPSRPQVEGLRHFPARCAAEALRQLRASDEPPIAGVEGVGLLRWTIGHRPAGQARYYAVEGPRGPLCVVRYTLAGAEAAATIALEELPSNLGRGQLVYLRCECERLARVLYLDRDGRFRCRRCVRPVYASSRDSDARVSRLLAGHRWPDEPPGDLREYDAAALRRLAEDADRGLILLLKAADRIASTHRGAGRPWSAARRAAQGRRRQPPETSG